MRKDSEGKTEDSRKVKEAKRAREDIGEDLLGSEKEKRIHREYVREEKKRIEKEWREEKKRRIEEEKEPRLGWSKPKQPEWQKPRKGEENFQEPGGQMRADDFGKRQRVEAEEDGEKIEATDEWESLEEEGKDGGKRRKLGQIEIMRLECLVGEWVEEVECQMLEEEEWEEVVQDAWDDVHEGHSLDPAKVKEGREEELGFMNKRGIWTIRPTKEC